MDRQMLMYIFTACSIYTFNLSRNDNDKRLSNLLMATVSKPSAFTNRFLAANFPMLANLKTCHQKRLSLKK